MYLKQNHISEIHFISKLKAIGEVPEGAILATLDVTSLYTNIPNQEGLVAVADKLRSDPPKTRYSYLHLGLTQTSAAQHVL